MKLFLDTEFNGFGGELLSLALFPEDSSKEFYLEFEPTEEINLWVRNHVMPLMIFNHKWTDPIHGRIQLQGYLAQFETIEIIVDWPDDIKYFCEFLITGPGEMINTIPKIIFELRRDIDSEGSAHPHNALYDAIALKEAYAKM